MVDLGWQHSGQVLPQRLLLLMGSFELSLLIDGGFTAVAWLLEEVHQVFTRSSLHFGGLKELVVLVVYWRVIIVLFDLLLLN